MCTYVQMYIYICTYLHVYVCMYVCIYIYIHIYIHIHSTVYTYTHTYILIYNQYPTHKPMSHDHVRKFTAEAVPNTPSSTHHWDSWRVTWSESVVDLEHGKNRLCL